MKYILRFFAIWLSLSACFCHSALAESEEELLKRHSLWIRYENEAKGVFIINYVIPGEGDGAMV
jgi:hypothetical protein